MQGNDRSNQRRQVNGHLHIVRLDEHGTDHFLRIQIGQEIDNGLQVGDNFRIDRLGARGARFQILLAFDELFGQCAQTGQFALDERGDRTDGRVVDVSQQVFDTDFFGFLGSHFGGNVRKGELDLSLSALGGDFFDDLVRSGRHGLTIGSNVNDTKDGRSRSGFREKSLDNVVNAKIVGTNLRTGGIKSNHSFLGMDFSEHGQHVLQVVVIQVKYGLHK